MKSRKLLSIVSSALITSTLIIGCGNNTDTTDDTTNNPVSEAADDAVDDATDAVDDATDDATDDLAGNDDENGDLKDGTYRVENKDFDDKGYKAYATITVADGKITASEYDYLDKDGNKKSENTEYETSMKEKTGTGPAEYTKELAKQLVDKQDPSKIEAVTGATNSSNTFKDFAQKLVDAAKEGKTETIIVEATE